MLPSALRSALICLGLALAAGTAFAQPAPAVAEDARLLPYAEPGQLVDIGGRRINLKCSGAGTPTVILMAGFSSWSPVWYKTQPEIARQTRVCAFDRPGYGFSDASPRPLILAQVPEDLHAALNAANLPGPYVLVGHSLGGLEARMFAERWPKEVAGMVLVDSGLSAQGLAGANMLSAEASQQAENETANSLRCAFLAVRGPLDPSSPDYRACVTPLPPETPDALRQVWPRFFAAGYAAAQVSLNLSLYTHRYDSADHVRLGDMPLVVLSADPSRFGPDPQKVWQPFVKWWWDGKKALASLSSRGVHRIVKDSGHLIQLDNPQAVIDAVDEVLRKLPASRGQ